MSTRIVPEILVDKTGKEVLCTPVNLKAKLLFVLRIEFYDEASSKKATKLLQKERCKIYNKNVGLRQNKNVGKPTFLFCILGHIDTLLLEVFQYENQFTRRVNHHGQFRG